MALSTKTDAPKDSRRVKEIPYSIVDPRTNQKYVTGELLGKGGFAKCYRLKDVASKKMFACKVFRKIKGETVKTQLQKDRISEEVAIHQRLDHKNIVNFHGSFDDADNMYILLELCPNKSLWQVYVHRDTLSEPETRYFFHQIVSGCKYLHENLVIHRDLKLDNMFISGMMEIKIGDFGMATTSRFHGERIKMICGTPDYAAPEMLNHEEYGQEVDVWAVGCILYALLAGRLPFHAMYKKDVLAKIKMNRYHIPFDISPSARNLIRSILQSNPNKRPTMAGILEHSFMTTGYLPSRLPMSCLTTEPSFDIAKGKNMTKSGDAKVGEQGQAAGRDKNEPQDGKDDESEVCHFPDWMVQLSFE